MTDAQIEKVVDSLDGVPEALHSFYIETDDGKFQLEDVGGLKKVLDDKKNEIKKLKDRMRTNGHGEEGLTKEEKEELATLRADRSKREEDDLKKRGEFDKLLLKKDEVYGQKLSDMEKRATKAEQRLFDAEKRNVATLAIQKMKGKPKALLDHVTKHLTVEEEKDGSLNVVVVDRDGTPRSSKKDPAKPMSIEELIEVEYVDNEDFMGLFEGRGASGSGASGGGGAKRGGADISITKAEAKNHQIYKQRQEEAKKKGVKLVYAD